MVVPEIAIRRAASERMGSEPDVRLTLAALMAPDDTAEDVLERLEGRLAELNERPLPLLDPAPTGPLSGGKRDAARALRGGGGRARPR